VVHVLTVRAYQGVGALVGFLLMACSPTIAPTPARSPAVRETVAPSVGSFPATAPGSTSPTADPSPFVLPNPGGTCIADQFATEPATIAGQPASLGTAHVLVTQPLENTGADCVLAVPEVIGLASGSGPLTATGVRNLGLSVCTNGSCHHEYPTSFKVESGQRFQILLSAWWWLPLADSVSHPPCEQALADVSKVAFPLSEGTVEIAWATGVLHEVCAAPPSLSVGLDTR
jgi:hypothetical protein